MSVVLAFTVLLTALPNISLTVDALPPTNPTDTTQTGYGSLIDFQKDKWNNILDDTFKNNGVVKHINLIRTVQQPVMNLKFLYLIKMVLVT